MALMLFAATGAVFAQDTLDVAANAVEQRFLADAEALLATHQSEAAYALLSAREVELAGDPYFDYLLGIAALDTGKHSDAIFSLRRSLAVAPEFSGARMELARAYFENGSAALARPLFVQLLTERPPAAVRAVIDRYIASIDARPNALKSSLRMYMEMGGGYDSNANGSTDNQQFLGFTLNADNVQTESPFAELAAGFNWNGPRNTRFGRYAGGRLSYRHNSDAAFVDSAVLSGLAGINWQRGAIFGRAGAETYWATRDGASNQRYIGIDALLGNRIKDRLDITLAVRGGAIRHTDAIDILDVDRLLFVGGVTYRFASPGSLKIEIIGGNDSERATGSPYGNSKSGGRLSLRFPVSTTGHFFASTGSLTSDYDGLFFGAPRKDTQLTTTLQIEFRNIWIEGLSLTPRLRYVDNDSTIALYDYDRTEVGLLLRWTPQ